MQVSDVRMPFTDEKASDLFKALRFISDSGIPVEAFDAFLAEYLKSRDIDQSISFAIHEWDL